MLNENRNDFVCRICGLDQQERPWGADNHSPTFGICPCCGAEFGYHDFTLVGIREHRANWLSNGAKWRDPKIKPVHWSPEEQLKNIPAKYK